MPHWPSRTDPRSTQSPSIRIHSTHNRIRVSGCGLLATDAKLLGQAARSLLSPTPRHPSSINYLPLKLKNIGKRYESSYTPKIETCAAPYQQYIIKDLCYLRVSKVFYFSQSGALKSFGLKSNPSVRIINSPSHLVLSRCRLFL
jgi:hypothetical protein